MRHEDSETRQQKLVLFRSLFWIFLGLAFMFGNLAIWSVRSGAQLGGTAGMCGGMAVICGIGWGAIADSR